MPVHTITKATVFPRSNDTQTCQLKNVVTNPAILVGDYTYYHDFEAPLDFEHRNVLYLYPVNHDTLVIGKFCSIAAGAKFLFNGGNHKGDSFANYPFAIFPELWEHTLPVQSSWDNKGDIRIGNDVWIGHEALILAGVTIGDGARIAARAVVTKDVEPYAVVGGVPAKRLKRRFDDATIALLEELRWWDLDEETIRANLPLLMNADRAALQRFAEARRRP